uniref:Uncharacterized protein n=1 Tax=uncultured Nocardioidaceae bacterium TaxID=253824 RepID=A0A6J4LKX0_9ACTN|nr:MAG: hypothetical protein AVDCRST_MAG46-1662 [uncultured Nocardioidaceae bacterium]
MLCHDATLIDLEDFLTLRGANVDQVADFASRHGVLVGHVEKSPGHYGEHVYEPLHLWHQAVERATALRTAAAKLRASDLLSDDERVPVLRAAWPDVEESREALLMYASRTLDDDRSQLAWAVSTWLESARAGLALIWPTGANAPTVAIGGAMPWGCLQAITVQVALACSRAESAARSCDGCGAPHAPRRQPKPGQRSFCQKCREAGVPVKLAHRDRRARQRSNGAEKP